MTFYLYYFYHLKTTLKPYPFSQKPAFCKKYLAKSRVKARLFVWKGYRKGKQNLSVYEKRFIVRFSVVFLVSLAKCNHDFCRKYLMRPKAAG